MIERRCNQLVQPVGRNTHLALTEKHFRVLSNFETFLPVIPVMNAIGTCHIVLNVSRRYSAQRLVGILYSIILSHLLTTKIQGL